MERLEKRALLLSGPQHWDEKRPTTHYIRRIFEHWDPLGIAIVSAFLKKHGFETMWVEMDPKNKRDITGLMEKSGVVCISSRFFDTSLAVQAVKEAERRNKLTIVGGYGPTFAPELFEQASSVVYGEFEPIGDQVITDLLSGRLQPVYDSRLLPPFDIKNSYVWPDRTIFPNWRWPHSEVKKYAQEWQRGCTNYCTFCSPTRMQRVEIVDGKRRIRTRDINDIKEEIEKSIGLERGGHLFPVDLNSSAIDSEELRELAEYLKRKGIRWYTEGTVFPLIKDLREQGEDESILKLMSAKDGGGGCYSFLYGVDDLVSEKVAGSKDKEIGLLQEAVSLFRRMSIPLNLSVVVGLDNHHYPETFFQIAGILEEVRAPYSFIHIATPYAGTVWGDQVIKEGRVFDQESTHYNHRRVIAAPKNMTSDELQQGYYWLLSCLNTPSAIGETAHANFSPLLFAENPALALLQTGLVWGIETNLTVSELSLRGHMNHCIQKELDFGFRDWKSRN